MSTAQINTLSDTLKELLDDARRTGEPVRIVEDGAVVAQLVPESPPTSAHSHHDTQRVDIDQLRAEISMTWPNETSAVDAIHADRSRLDEDPAARRARTRAALAAIDRLGVEIAKDWPDRVTSVDAIDDVRRGR